MISYNLLTKSWIRVIDTDYSEKEVSLLELFAQAHELRAITDSNPLVIASLYRLLLVILYRALKLPDNEKAWLKRYRQGKFPDAVAKYFTRLKVKDRFDLFSEKYPFFQTADFKKDGKTSCKKLSPDFATANNKTLFSHHSDADRFSLTNAEAARYLLVSQYFSLGGGISGSSNLAKKHPNYTHTPLIGGVLTYLSGENLFKTLMLNLKPLNNNETSKNDVPVWEANGLQGVGEREPTGMLDYMTFKCRHVRLLPDKDGKVADMYISQGYSLPSKSWFRENEPAFVYRLNDKQGKKYKVAVSFAKSFWRDSRSIYQRINLDDDQDWDSRPACFRWMADLLEYEDIGEQEVGCLVIGMENAKANPLSWIYENLPVNVKLLMDSPASSLFAQAIDRAEEIASKKIYAALRTYAENVLPPNSKKEQISRFVKIIDSRANYWSALSSEYPGLVRDITEYEDKVYENWLKACIQAARKTLDIGLDNQLGRTTKELKARIIASQKLNVLLAPYKKELSYE